MTTGRNDPCPCGSGRKFKRCHGSAAQIAQSPDQLLWRRLRNLLDDFGNELAEFTEGVFGEEALLAAWDEFHSWDTDAPPLDDDPDDRALFASWFFHVWTPDPDEDVVPDATLNGRTPSGIFLERKRDKIDPLLRQYLEGCAQIVPSFYSVLKCDRGRGLVLRDIITGTEHDVIEHDGSQNMQVDDVIYAMLVSAAGITVIEGVGEVIMPPVHKIAVIELRQQLFGKKRQIPRTDLLDMHIEFRELYLAIAARARDPTPPKMQNTDGDPIEPRKMVFDVRAPEEAFAALKHLDVLTSDAEHEPFIKRDATGALKEVAWHWTRPDGKGSLSVSGTTLGVLRIAGTRLTAEVNSRKRADELRTIIERTLGDAVTFRISEILSLEKHMENLAVRGAGNRVGGMDEKDAAQIPEVRDAVRKMIAAHYETWPDEKIPALGNRTPREAVRTRDGRDKVDALLTQFQRDSAGQAMGPDPEVFLILRQQLGLSSETDS